MALGVPGERIHVAYLGVEAHQFHRGERADAPTLLYLGRLKRYKRIEHVLDVLESVPGATLDIAGDGDHRATLEAEIAQRGLGDRVRLHGFVDEERKAELYGRAWVSLTASSAEGWCLTVMEAAACGTPSAALAVGGLPESIVDGETGVLADDPAELAARVRGLVERPRAARTPGRRRRGAGALVHVGAHRGGQPRGARARRRRGSRVAARLAGAFLDDQGRGPGGGEPRRQRHRAALHRSSSPACSGADGYGSLAALVSTFLILSVPGSAMQVATAREIALGRLGHGGRLSATLEALDAGASSPGWWR